MREQTPFEEAIELEISVTRLLVLLECDDGFRQVLLTHDQFRKVGDCVIHEDKGIDEDGMQNATFRLNLDSKVDKIYFEGMSDYEEKYG